MTMTSLWLGLEAAQVELTPTVTLTALLIYFCFCCLRR